MENQSNTKPDSNNSKKKAISLGTIKDIVSIVVSIIGLGAVIVAYSNFQLAVTDPARTPSLDVDCKMEKVFETRSHHIVKLSFDIRSKSKRKVEVVSNYCVLLGRSDSLNNWTDPVFYEKIQSEVAESRYYSRYPIELNKSFGSIDRVIGFYQVIPDHSFFLPEQSQHTELITAIPKEPYVDRAMIQIFFDYGFDVENVQCYYFSDPDTGIFARLYIPEKNGSKDFRELKFYTKEDSIFSAKHGIASTYNVSEIWLDTSKAKEESTLIPFIFNPPPVRQDGSGNTNTFDNSGSATTTVTVPTQQLPHLTGTWVNQSNKARWEITQTGSKIEFNVFKTKGNKKGHGSGVVTSGGVQVVYHDFTFDVYEGTLYLSPDNKLLDGILTSHSGLKLEFQLDKQ